MLGRLFTCTRRLHAPKSINSVTLVGVVHDIQNGFVYEDPVTQFVLTTTSICTTSASNDCIVEKDHHTIRCFGEAFSTEVKNKIKEGNVVSVSGRMRLNPQLETSCNKHFYFPFIHVQPPHGYVTVVHGDRRKPPPTVSPSSEEIAAPTQPTTEESTTPPASATVTSNGEADAAEKSAQTSPN